MCVRRRSKPNPSSALVPLFANGCQDGFLAELVNVYEPTHGLKEAPMDSGSGRRKRT